MNKRLIKQVSLSVSFILSAGISLAEETSYICPEKISAKSTVLQAPDTWETNSNLFDHFLVSPTFSSGHPSLQGFLKPSTIVEKHSPDTNIAIYDLSHVANENLWLVCQYGNTPATLAKRLTKPHTSCRISIPKDGSEQKIICRSK